jgi:hypothetical protein
VNNLHKISYILRNPPKPCPVKGFPMALKDLSYDGTEAYSVVISLEDFSDARLTTENRIAIAQWLMNILLPELNTIAPVGISKIEKSLNAVNGWDNVER